MWEIASVVFWIAAYGLSLALGLLFGIVSFDIAMQRLLHEVDFSLSDRIYVSLLFSDLIVQAVTTPYGIYIMSGLLEQIWRERTAQQMTFDQHWKNYLVGELLNHPVGQEDQKARLPTKSQMEVTPA